MTTTLDIRPSEPRDLSEIEKLYPAAFPDEDLLPLVQALLQQETIVLSLVALEEGALTGHVAFTRCGLAGQREDVALLGPLAVTPARQGRGLGSALVAAGFARLKEAGCNHVLVLGDPAYYGRFGFKAETGVAMPYLSPSDSLPEEWQGAWQSLSLHDRSTLQDEPAPQGELSLPQPWRNKSLWLP